VNLPRIDSGDILALGLFAKKAEDERLLAREPVTFTDLLPARDETWWHGLQAGVLGTDLARLELHLSADAEENGSHLRGYSIELRESGRSFRRHFSMSSLAPAAQRIAHRLVEQKTIQEDEDYRFFLTVVPPEETGSPPQSEKVRVTRRSEPLVFENGRLADFLDRSELLAGSPEPEEGAAPQPHLFVSEEVWQQGHQQARRGGERESAAVWTGRVFRDTESPAAFLVLDACIEAEHATEQPLSVTFSGETWARVREVLQLRRRHLKRPHERLIGTVHGHNFGPQPDAEGRQACAACATAKVCGRTTAVLSTADLDWHRAVFAGQPWAVSLVWGHSARGEDWRMYGLADATLTPRPVRLLRE
jgi:hypothetical protein